MSKKKEDKQKQVDRIFKENVFLELLPIFKQILNIGSFEVSEVIPEKLQHTLEREPDFARIANTHEGEKFILHIEIQSSNDSTMLHRMRLYHALFTLKYKYPIKQFVIYVGDDKLTMESELKEEEIYKGYELKDVRSYSSEGLTKSDIPEEIIMAVLGDFGNEPAEKVIGLIIERLRVVSQDEGKLGKYVYQLTTLSKLRKLEEITIKKVKDMALTIDLTDSVLYKEGEKAGENKTKRKMVLNLLKKGTFSIESIAELAEVSVEFVKSAQAEESKK